MGDHYFRIGDNLDYYVIEGDNIDGAIAVTRKSPVPPPLRQVGLRILQTKSTYHTRTSAGCGQGYRKRGSPSTTSPGLELLGHMRAERDGLIVSAIPGRPR